MDSLVILWWKAFLSGVEAQYIAYNRYNIPHIMKTKFTQTMMTFGHVSSEGDIMLLHIFEQFLLTQFRWLCGVVKHQALVEMGGATGRS